MLVHSLYVLELLVILVRYLWIEVEKNRCLRHVTLKVTSVSQTLLITTPQYVHEAKKVKTDSNMLFDDKNLN